MIFSGVSRLIRFTVFSVAALLLQMPSVSHAVIDLSDTDLSFDEWALVEGGQIPFAGVRANSSGFRALGIAPLCREGLAMEYLVDISVAIGQFYSIFINRQFLPGLDRGAVTAGLLVDDGEPVLLENLAVGWADGLLTVRGTMDGVAHRETIERGASILANIHYGPSPLITQSFSLNGSSGVLAQLSCP